MKRKYLISIVILVLVIVLANILFFNSNDTTIQSNFILSETNIENISKLSLIVKSSENIDDLAGKIVLPKEIELIEGDLNWEEDLIKDEEKEISIQIKTEKEGNFEIQGFVGANSIQAEIEVDSARAPILRQRTYSIKEYEESKYEKDPRTWLIPTIDGKIVPEPLKDEEFNDYFKSLNLVDEEISVLIQFEGEEGNPDPKWVKTLEKDGVQLFDWHGDYVYDVIIPKKVLEEKSYDFIRWAGVKDYRLKLPVDLREKAEKNCSGKLEILILFYEESNKEQLEKIKEVSGVEISMDNFEDIIQINLNIRRIEELAKLGFVEKIELIYLPTICPPMKNGDCATDPFENIICY